MMRNETGQRARMTIALQTTLRFAPHYEAAVCVTRACIRAATVDRSGRDT